MFRGVTSERDVEQGTVILDVGGGSTELVAGGPDGVRWHDSLDIGSVRLTERFLKSDPPTGEELDACATAVRSLLAERVPDEIRGGTRFAVGVAGTITSLAALALGTEEYDRDRVHGFELGSEALESQLERLASVPVDQRKIGQQCGSLLVGGVRHPGRTAPLGGRGVVAARRCPIGGRYVGGAGRL